MRTKLRWIVAGMIAAASLGCAKSHEVNEPGKASGPLRNAKYLDVTQVYGDLVLSAAEIRAAMDRSECDIPGEQGSCGLYAKATHADGKPWTAWSGYYLRYNDNYLFSGSSSPLKKYDSHVSRATGQNPGAAEYEANPENQLYNANLDNSSGRCNAWALASLLEREPGKKGASGFSRPDLKALLMRSYEMIEPGAIEIFGHNFAREQGGGELDDIYPDQLHRFIQAELFEKSVPFIIDADKASEIWNQPIWAVRIFISKSGANALEVTTYLQGARMLTSAEMRDNDGDGAVESNIELNYELRGEWQADGGFKVTDASWIGHSAVQHPDFVVRVPSEPIKHWSDNAKLDTAIVDQLVAQSHR